MPINAVLTLVKLTLSGRYALEVESVFLPALKSLFISAYSGIGFDSYCCLLDGCPALEELYIREAESDHSHATLSCSTFVKSASIKRLVVFSDVPKCIEDHREACFEAPSLVYLDYSSYVFRNYEFVDLDSLVEARLNLRLWESTIYYDSSESDDDNDDFYNSGYSVYDWYSGMFGDITNLVAGITNITTLHLSPHSLEVSLCYYLLVY